MVEYVRHRRHRFQSENCRKCFHTCASFEFLRSHQDQTSFLFDIKTRYKNHFSVQVQRCQKLPIRVSSRFTTSLVVDLLLVTDGSKYHFMLISHLQNLVEYLRLKRHRFQLENCRKCFHTRASFERHQDLCYQDEDVAITIPKPQKMTTFSKT